MRDAAPTMADLPEPPQPHVAEHATPPAEEAAKPPSPPTAPEPAQKAPTPALALLNVEVFDEDVAVTVQNKGRMTVNGFDLNLKYFVLPGDQLVFESNEKAIAQFETARLERVQKAKTLDAGIGALGRNLKLVSTDVFIWTPSHIKALPDAEQWRAFGDSELTEAGLALSSTAATFAAGASSNDTAAREQALTIHLLDLARRTEDMKPLLKNAIQRTTAARTGLAAEQSSADEHLERLNKQQRELQPRLAGLMEEARKQPVRVETLHVDAVIEPELVQRIKVKRQKNDHQGVVVELARQDGRQSRSRTRPDQPDGRHSISPSVLSPGRAMPRLVGTSMNSSMRAALSDHFSSRAAALA